MDGHDDPQFREALITERRRRFFAIAGFGPAGVAVAATVYAFISIRHVDSTRITIWFAAALATVLIALAGAFSRFRHIRGSDGLPLLATIAHLGFGLIWGSAYWIDLNAADSVSGHRYLTLALLLTIALNTAGPSGALNRLGLLVSLPMLGLATLALVVIARWPEALVTAAAFIGQVFLQSWNRQAVHELLRLRLVADESAAAHAAASRRDHLTELANRLAATERLESPAPTDSYLLFVDLDHFKAVNDRFGHAAGDSVLVDVSRRLTDLVPENTFVGRIGGDEFLLITSQSANELADEIIDTIEQPFTVDVDGQSQVVYISASIGSATVVPGRSGEDQLYRVDTALYEAKRSGRRRSVDFDSLHGERQGRGIDTVVLEAVRTGGITAHAQPIFDFQDGSIPVVELLARLQTPSGEVLPPDRFIPAAVENGLSGDITDQMLAHACRLANLWRDDSTLSNARVVINISAADLRDGSLERRVRRAVASHNADAARLGIELTETMALEDVACAARQFSSLNHLGVMSAIDDFGSGYFSPEQLLQLPIAGLKLDRSLIAQGTDTRSRDFIEALTGVARSVVDATNICAEGIETFDQLQLVCELGIGNGQGYLLQRPVPADELSAALTRNASTRDRLRAQLGSPNPTTLSDG